MVPGLQAARAAPRHATNLTIPTLCRTSKLSIGSEEFASDLGKLSTLPAKTGHTLDV
jgi:hypothetical protein